METFLKTGFAPFSLAAQKILVAQNLGGLQPPSAPPPPARTPMPWTHTPSGTILPWPGRVFNIMIVNKFLLRDESLRFCINMAQHELIRHEWTFKIFPIFLVKERVFIMIRLLCVNSPGYWFNYQYWCCYWRGLVWLLLSYREVVTIFRISWWSQKFGW